MVRTRGRARRLLPVVLGVAGLCSIALATAELATFSGGWNANGAEWFGQSVALSDDTAVIGAPLATTSGGGASQGRVAVYTRTASGWSDPQVLTGPAGTTYKQGFGHAVAIDGEQMVVGAAPHLYYYDDGFGPGGPPGTLVPAGASNVYFYTRDADGTWVGDPVSGTLSPKLIELGRSVAIAGDTAIAGAPFTNPRDLSASDPSVSQAGVVQVYGRIDGTWTPTQVLRDSSPVSLGHLGTAVAMSDDTVVAGGLNGVIVKPTVVVWKRTSESAPYQVVQRIVPPTNQVHFGMGVAISTDSATLFIASPQDASASVSGSLHVYELNASTGLYALSQTLHAGDAIEDEKIGASLALHGDTLLAGAPGRALVGGDYRVDQWYAWLPGSVHAFVRGTDGQWSWSERIRPAQQGSLDQYGQGVAIRNGVALVGAPHSGSLSVGSASEVQVGSASSGPDETPPTLSLPSNITQEATSASGRVVTFTATATDAVSGSVAVTCSPASGSTFPIGTTTVSCSASDAAGNTATGSFTVTVRDTTGPAISVPATITAEATGASGAAVTYSVSATDLVSGSRPVTSAPAPGSTFPLGATTVSCSSTDAAGNTSSASFTVTVRDTTKPALSLPAAITAEATGASGAAVTFAATASDLVSGTVAVLSTPASGSTFPLGTTTVGCAASDAAGNTQTGTFSVTVVDTTAPLLSLPTDLTADLTSGETLAVTYGGSATDLVSGSRPVVFTPASGSQFGVGTTTVHASATDAAGNTATGSFTVTVRDLRDSTPPVLSLPANITVEATSASGNVVTFTASALDAVSGDRPVTCSPASGSTFPIGTTTVSCSATDAAGNTATGSFSVTVRDTTAPAISAVTLSTTEIWPPNHQMVSIGWTASATDLGSAVTVQLVSVTSNEPDNGTGDGDTAGDISLNTSTGALSVRAERSGSGNGRIYTLTFAATDASGNTTTTTRTVTVPKSKGK